MTKQELIDKMANDADLSKTAAGKALDATIGIGCQQPVAQIFFSNK